MSARILITGATGFIGQVLSRELVSRGYEVTALSRRPDEAKKILGDGVSIVQWDAITCTGWEDCVNGSLAVVNLTGASLASGRWTADKKEQILASRLQAGHALVQAVEKARNRPQVLVQASGIGYYGNSGGQVLSESSPVGTGFLADVAREWEQSVKPVESLGVRLVIGRLGAVLGTSGGLLPRVLPAFRAGVGGYPGSGKQWFSWVHIDDVVAAILFLVETWSLMGRFNLTAPNPMVVKEFYRLLGKVMRRPVVFPMPAFALKLLLGQIADELLLAGQRVLPERLLQAGYEFKYAEAKSALESIVR